jgi:hypothetical protein
MTNSDTHAQAADAWHRAVELRRALIAGEELPRLPMVPVRLEPGEVPHAELGLGYSRYYGMDVTYQQTSGFYYGSPGFVAAGLVGNAIGNSLARSNAERMAEAQWREFQQVAVYVTSHRLLSFVNQGWLEWSHRAMMTLDIDLQQWSVVQTFQECEPLRWNGLGAIWLAVALTYLGFGTDHLIHRPEFAPMGPAAPPVEPGGGYELDPGAGPHS